MVTADRQVHKSLLKLLGVKAASHAGNREKVSSSLGTDYAPACRNLQLIFNAALQHAPDLRPSTLPQGVLQCDNLTD
jgi:hypothetical protein